MARALAGAGRLAEAVAVAEEALASPSVTISDFVTLDSALSRMPAADAARLCEKAAGLFPRHAEVYPRWADALLRDGRMDEAIAVLTRGEAATHPTSAPVLRLAQLLLDAGRTQEAIERLDAVLAREPRNKDAAALKAKLPAGDKVPV